MRGPSPDFLHVLCVFLGGGLGSVMRYLLSIFFNDPESNFPVGTFMANSIGGFMIAVFSSIMDAIPSLAPFEVDAPLLKALLITGFCGGFTTYSTFSFETHKLLAEGQTVNALVYIFVTIITSLGIIGATAACMNWLLGFLSNH